MNAEKVSELRGDIGAIRWVLIPSFNKPRSSSAKDEPFSQERHLKIPLLSRGWNCQILNQVVESELSTSFWNRYHQQWLSDIELNQISVFFFLVLIQGLTPCFTAGKRILVWNCHVTCEHRNTTIFTSLVNGSMWQNLDACFSHLGHLGKASKWRMIKESLAEDYRLILSTRLMVILLICFILFFCGAPCERCIETDSGETNDQ